MTISDETKAELRRLHAELIAAETEWRAEVASRPSHRQAGRTLALQAECDKALTSFRRTAGDAIIPLLDALEAAEDERDRLRERLTLAEYLSRKASLSETERLADTRATILAALGDAP